MMQYNMSLKPVEPALLCSLQITTKCVSATALNSLSSEDYINNLLISFYVCSQLD